MPRVIRGVVRDPAQSGQVMGKPCWTPAARAVVQRRPDPRRHAWQAGGFIHDPEIRELLVPQLHADFLPARPASWRLNDDLLATVLARRRRLP